MTHGSNPTATGEVRLNSSGKTFSSRRYGVRIDYPRDWILRRTFKRSYLASGGWKAYTGPDSPSGRPLVALILPGSNDITAAELRIGVSRRPDALRTCTDLPVAARPGTQGQTIISGVTFTTFEAGDAAMSHYLTTRSYRAVHQATCYAMDVLVFGASPEVYDPPVAPPFTKAQAFAHLIPVARNLRFIAGSSPAATVAPIISPSTYKGLLPCADCPGIVYQLNLLPDHRYHMRLNYQDRAARFDEYGGWRTAPRNRYYRKKVHILRHSNGLCSTAAAGCAYSAAPGSPFASG